MQLISGVENAGRALQLFTGARPEWGATELARELQMSKSHAHRILATLADIGLLRRTEAAGRFRLSWSFFSFSSVLRDSDPLVLAALPSLTRMRSAYALDPWCCVWGGDVLLALHADLSVQRLAFSDNMTASMVVAAGLAADELQEATQRETSGFPPPNVVSRCTAFARSDNVLSSRKETTDGLQRVMAAAIKNADGRVVAALAVTIPERPLRMTNLLGTIIKREALIISTALQRSSEADGRPVISTTLQRSSRTDALVRD